MNKQGLILTVDGQGVEAREGQTILEAALAGGIYIPHLCHHPDLPSFQEAKPVEVCFRGSEPFRSTANGVAYQGCGLCAVLLEGQTEPVLACVTLAAGGMEITNTGPEIEAFRKDRLASIFAHHPHACLTCAQNEGCSLTQCSTNVPEEERCCPVFDVCELRKVVEYVGLKEDLSRYIPRSLYAETDKPLFIRDDNLCVGCLRCVRVCDRLIGAKSLGYVIHNGEVIVGTTRRTIEESGCRFCGACAEVCPTGAIRDKDLKPGDRREALVPCTASCPVGMDVPAYVDFVRQGRYEEAASLIRKKTPLAHTLGYICAHPCEEACRRSEVNQPIAICDIKRLALAMDTQSPSVTKVPETGRRVAVVGGGPSGLVASYFLARKGHAVTVFEAEEEAGGMLRWAVPDYRLPRHIIRKEIEGIKAIGVEIITGSRVTEQRLREDLNLDRWDAVFLATGASESKKIDVPGLTLDGVLWGLEFLRKAKEGRTGDIEGSVAVIGGGNVAVDAAMTALRLGAKSVEMAYLEQREEMPAYSWEIREAEEEGVVIHPGWGPARILADGRRWSGVELQRCTSVFDAKGSFCPSFDSAQKKTIKADTVIFAVGQKADLSFLPEEWGLRVSEAETLVIKPDTGETSRRGIFAGGELASGPGSAVEAMAAGRRAAAAIDEFLAGDGTIDRPSPAAEQRSLWIGEDKDFASWKRIEMCSLPAEERFRSFGLIRMGYSESEARSEAERCLRCDMRLQLRPMILPPEKWLELNQENVEEVPEAEGVFQLLDEGKKIIYIAGAPDMRKELEEQLAARPEAKYFGYEPDPMYTKRESELIQRYLQKHGHLPPGNEEIGDLF